MRVDLTCWCGKFAVAMLTPSQTPDFAGSWHDSLIAGIAHSKSTQLSSSVHSPGCFLFVHSIVFIGIGLAYAAPDSFVL